MIVMNPFSYLRRKAAEAIVLGTADGLRAVTPEGEQVPQDLGELRQLLATTADVKAIAAAAPTSEPTATEPEPASRRRAK
jgi:hypothetical protein